MDTNSDNTGIGKIPVNTRGAKRKLTNRKLSAKPTNQSTHRRSSDIVSETNEVTEVEKEGNDTMEALLVTPRIPVNAILARIHSRQEEQRLKAASQGKKREQINLILGTEGEAYLPPGERIKLRRTVLKLTQNALAAAADISQGTLSLIESGDRDSSPVIIIKLAQLLGITPPTDIYKYYEKQLEDQPTLSVEDQENAGRPQFLFLPPALNADDRKLLNNMAASLLQVRLAEQGMPPTQPQNDFLEGQRTTQNQQKLNNQRRNKNSDVPHNMHNGN